MIKGCDYQQADTAGHIFIIILVLFASIGFSAVINFIGRLHTRFMDWYARVER